ncbi:MAG: TonB family protein [Pseudomonadota bacterium]
MNPKLVRWLLAVGLALAIHGLLLFVVFRAPSPTIEVAGGSFSVNFGSAGSDTAAAQADRGGETAPDTPEATAPPEPEPRDSQPATPPDTLAEPMPEPPVDLDGLSDEAPVDTEAPTETPEIVPEVPPEPQTVAPKPAATDTNPSAPTDAVMPSQKDAAEAGTNTESQSADGSDADDSVASPAGGSPTADSDAQAASSEAGNAEASNYAGQIVRILLRERLPASVPRGAARVSFSIDLEGDIVSMVIKEGSGSKRFDRAAMKLIKSCAPFPRPPEGAMLDYSVEIKKD